MCDIDLNTKNIIFSIDISKIFLPKGETIMKYDKDMLIGDLLAQAPEKADILLEAGMHCLSCPASQMESLAEACEVHEIDVEELLQKLNAED